MRNVRYLINDQFNAHSIAEDLRVQLDVNRFSNINVVAVERRNEVIVQVPEANGSVEEVVDSFMENYQTGVILE
ncbi:MAG TPA: hypothetical protein DCR24_05275 [Bacillus bacterium]|nr:hypothetical protein [Bacillus sp. (in: firmicutes)]